jgi:hypothetical protein
LAATRVGSPVEPASKPPRVMPAAGLHLRLLQEGQITDEARRRIERELDLEEESLAFNRKGETDPPL